MILRRYLTGSLVGPFLLGFGIITFLLTMEMLLDLLDLLISKGIAPWIVARLFCLALGWMVALSIPCGVLVAALMTYGRLSQDNEIIALRASGVHLLQIIAPALVLSVIVAVGLTLFNNYVLPEANYAYATLMQDISHKRPTAEIREGVMITAFRGYDLWIGQLDDRTGAMGDILILDGRAQPEAPRTIMAKTGTLQYRPEDNALSLTLHDGEIHEADPTSTQGEYRRLRFETQVMNITNASDQWPEDSRHQRGDREMSITAMHGEIRRLQGDQARQDSLVRVALRDLPIKSVEELDRIDPDPSSATGVEMVLGALSKLLPIHRSAPAARPWNPTQKRALELAHARTRELRYVQRKINELQVEIQKKFSIPVACIAFVLVGAPLGIMARRGGLTAGFLSAVFFIFYYLCLVAGEQLSNRLFLPPWLAMWLPNIILGGLGIYLTTKAVASGQTAPRRRTGKAA